MESQRSKFSKRSHKSEDQKKKIRSNKTLKDASETKLVALNQKKI